MSGTKTSAVFSFLNFGPGSYHFLGRYGLFLKIGDWKDLLTMSTGISCQASFTQWRTRLQVGAFFLPAGVNLNSPVISHDWYFLLMLSLNGLLRHLSKGCSMAVKLPVITAMSIFHRWRLLFVRWPWKESHTNEGRSSPGCHGKQLQIHSLTPTMKQRNKQINLQTSIESFCHRKYQKKGNIKSYTKTSFHTLFIHPSLLVE